MCTSHGLCTYITICGHAPCTPVYSIHLIVAASSGTACVTRVMNTAFSTQITLQPTRLRDGIIMLVDAWLWPLSLMNMRNWCRPHSHGRAVTHSYLIRLIRHIYICRPFCLGIDKGLSESTKGRDSHLRCVYVHTYEQVYVYSI